MRCSRRHTGVRARRLPPALADRTQLPMSKSDLLARRSTTTTRLDRSPPHHRVRRPRGQRLAGTPDRLLDQEARPAPCGYRSIAIRTGEHILHARRPLAGDRAGLHTAFGTAMDAPTSGVTFRRALHLVPASIRRSGHHASCGIRSSRCGRTRAYRLKRSHGWSATAVQPSRNWCTDTSSSSCSRPATVMDSCSSRGLTGHEPPPLSRG